MRTTNVWQSIYLFIVTCGPLFLKRSDSGFRVYISSDFYIFKIKK